MGSDSNKSLSFQKCLTGIRGLDEVTFGGLPKGRPTLLCGSAGSGKTLMAMEFIVKGALQYDEPGVYMAFEETEEELVQNVASLGFDLNDLVSRKKVIIDNVRVERSEIEETGEYDLEGLFVRIDHAINSIGAKRVVLDTIESLFAGLANEGILRAELRRLFRWLKDKGVTAIITGERGDGSLTRHGLEEYVSDCVILLDHRITNQISTRRLQIVKYRGSTHGMNEYPFLIDEHGISILPITSIGLEYRAPSERISSGIPRLDIMLGGKGFYKGSSILISGTAGTGKTSFAATFANSVCQRGERCIYFSFEESPDQIVRNMRSIGVNLEPWVNKDLLRMRSMRATLVGLESHLVAMINLIDELKPTAIVVDPISTLVNISIPLDVKLMLVRLIDYAKSKQITLLLTNLTHSTTGLEETTAEISSLMDTWILLRDIEIGGERNRGLYVLKSRGIENSNQIREFLLTDKGIDIINAYIGQSGVLTGSARSAQEARDRAEEVARADEIERLERDLERRRKAMEAQVGALRTEFEAKEDEIELLIKQAKARGETTVKNREEIGHLRKANGDGEKKQSKK